MREEVGERPRSARSRDASVRKLNARKRKQKRHHDVGVAKVESEKSSSTADQGWEKMKGLLITERDKQEKGNFCGHGGWGLGRQSTRETSPKKSSDKRRRGRRRRGRQLDSSSEKKFGNGRSTFSMVLPVGRRKQPLIRSASGREERFGEVTFSAYGGSKRKRTKAIYRPRKFA